MTTDILFQIEKNDKIFTKSERKVADFVKQSPQEVMYMSITDLAERCGVGDTTVFRFCKTLKLNGYQVFRVMLAQSLSNTKRAMTLSDEINISDSTDEVCRKILETDIAALKQTLSMIKIKDIHKAVEMMSNAQHIYFYGVGSSSVLALEAYNKFARITPNVIAVQDSHMQAMSSSLLNENDLAIAFSYSGSTIDVIDILKRAKQNKSKTICITRFADSPLTAYADIVLLCGANEGPLQGGALSAKVAQIYILDILYTEYFKNNYSVCDQNKKSTAQSVANKQL